MNLYEISATLENGAVHKTKIYEINQERALNRASKFALQFDATGCAKKTVQLLLYEPEEAAKIFAQLCGYTLLDQNGRVITGRMPGREEQK